MMKLITTAALLIGFTTLSATSHASSEKHIRPNVTTVHTVSPQAVGVTPTVSQATVTRTVRRVVEPVKPLVTVDKGVYYKPCAVKKSVKASKSPYFESNMPVLAPSDSKSHSNSKMRYMTINRSCYGK